MTSDERSARQRNRKSARRYPLFAATNTLDQVAHVWTPDEIRADRARRHNDLDLMFEDRRFQDAAKIVEASEAIVAQFGQSTLDDILANFSRTGYPPDYLAGHLCDKLRDLTGTPYFIW